MSSLDKTEMTQMLHPVDATGPVCSRCGICKDGQHRTPQECIDLAWNRLAELEIRYEGVATTPAGGRRIRKDNRYVILDGRRLCLSDAARELGITASALHYRLVVRTGKKDYLNVDVRAVGADRCCNQTRCNVPRSRRIR